MKRMVSFLLASSMLLSVGACAPGGVPDETSADTDVDTDVDTSADTSTTDTAEVTPPRFAALSFGATEKPDTSLTRDLRENILSDEDATTEVYALFDVAGITGKLARLLADEPTKTCDKSFTWNFGSTPKIECKPASPDLSGYEGIAFWVYADESAVGQSFVLNFDSENSATDGSDYYTSGVTKISESGWNYFSWKLSSLGATRSPLGWDQISKVTLTTTGWGMSNDTKTTLYLDSIRLYTNMNAINPLADISQLTNAAAFYIGGSRAIVDQKVVKISATDDTAVPFRDGDTIWLPLAPIAAVRADKADYTPDSGVLTMTLGGKSYRYTAGQSAAEIDGKSVTLPAAPVKRDGALFFPATYLAELFEFGEIFTDSMGTVILSDKEVLFDETKNLTTLFGIVREMLFIRPSAERILSDMADHLGGQDVHPRILASEDDFARLKSIPSSDKTLSTLLAKLKQDYARGSDAYISAPVTYEIKANRLLAVSNEALARITAWSLLYRLTDETHYADRAWKELAAVAAFKDWHPDHFLDTGVMCAAVATGYDWLYGYLSEQQRQTLEVALLEKGIMPGIDTYEGRRSIWGANNWSGVCNGGLTAAALAVAGVYPEEAGKLLSYCISGVEESLLSYAPDGGYVESPGYWTFGTRYMAYMIASLAETCGTDYGLYAAPGFAASAYFTAYFETSVCSWNFHDGNRNRTETDFLLFFSRYSDDPDISRLRLGEVLSGIKPVSFFDILWYDPDNMSESLLLPKDAYYSNVGAVTMRSGWDAKPIFVGLGGGSNSVAHGDLDIGNFVIDGAGIRFLDDLGSDLYELPEYFGNKRWTYYRKRAEGQNTLVIGDVSRNTPDQSPTARGNFTRVESAESASLAIVDMSTAYDAVTRGERGILFTDNRSTVIVQDEITLAAAETVRWQVHTRGKITVSDDGRSAVITDGGKRLWCAIVSDDAEARFSTMKAVSYDPNYKNSEGEYSRDNLTKLCIIRENMTEFRLAVVFRLLDTGESAPTASDIYTWQDMSEWTVE